MRIKKTKKEDILNKVKEDLLKQIEDRKLAKEKQYQLDKTTIPEHHNPHLYSCQHGSGLYPCSVCNKKYPIKQLTKRSQSHNRPERKKQFKS